MQLGGRTRPGGYSKKWAPPRNRVTDGGVGLAVVQRHSVIDLISSPEAWMVLALAFLLMVGLVLVAEGFGAHVGKGYIYGVIIIRSNRKPKPLTAAASRR